MGAVAGTLCPFTGIKCNTDCMLFLTAAPNDTVEGSILEGTGHCAMAVMASHMASENHFGGNYLMKTVAYAQEPYPDWELQ